ncbi:UNVERIFIED_CONTAM: External alternative NAD(P)H-ubiquinone oxidoreductase B1, mitochondrial [Sesamum latifolium]|uniref:External alternative NAD(P)H-ubiquinone oxidoreductase B1, mitochondrial n=1 Tax=Sesamum latifolium TaxID=2727402 RepID=A0AAW2WS78_9LAMI
MKSLPATAQVAAQQGAYLARCFNMREKCKSDPEGPRKFRSGGRHEFRPFQYRHLGQFAPLGGEQAAAELPGDWVSMGHSTQWLWYSVYARLNASRLQAPDSSTVHKGFIETLIQLGLTMDGVWDGFVKFGDSIPQEFLDEDPGDWSS